MKPGAKTRGFPSDSSPEPVLHYVLISLILPYSIHVLISTKGGTHGQSSLSRKR